MNPSPLLKLRLISTLILSLVLLLIPMFAIPSASGQTQPKRDPDLIRDMLDYPPVDRHLPSIPLPSSLPAVVNNNLTSKFVIQSYRNNNWNLFIMDYKGSNESTLYAGSAIDGYPNFARNGQQILFSSDQAYSGHYDIYRIQPDGQKKSRLTLDANSNINAAWSPDSSRIAYQSTRSGNVDIFVMNADGSNTIQLTNSAEYDGQPTWSPNGAQIAFTSKRTGSYDIWVMNSDGSDQRQLTFAANAYTPSWSPLGNRIAFSADFNGNGFLEAWWMNSDGSGMRSVDLDDNKVDHWNLVWSPDAEWLAGVNTTWVYRQDNWYWAVSILSIYYFYGSTTYDLPDLYTWDVGWADADIEPPGPCTVTVPSQSRSRSVPVKVSAVDNGSAGIAAYEIQVRKDASQSWQDFQNWAYSAGGVYQMDEVDQAEFRCRAYDLSGNVGQWTENATGMVSVDASWPSSYVNSLPNLVKGTSIPISWQGTDLGSGIASYDIFVRDGESGVWQSWKTGLATTSDTYTGIPGHTYSFRSQVHDAIGHTQVWQPEVQATVTFYATVLSITARDQRGGIAPAPEITLSPAPIRNFIGTLESQFYLSDGEYQISGVSAGYGDWPVTEISMQGDTPYEFLMRPTSDLIQNGGFEAGDLTGWSITGSGVTVEEGIAHTGLHALQFEHTEIATTQVGQAISIGLSIHEPTLSFLYCIPDALDSGSFIVEVDGAAPTAALVLSTSSETSGWAHAWADLSQYTGQNVTVTLVLSGTDGTVLVDEVSLGPWMTPQVDTVTPAEWLSPQAGLLTITGSNFIPTPTVYLDALPLTNVLFISPTLLQAQLPSDVIGGQYDLRVVNPGGAAGVLQKAVTIQPLPVYLPVVQRLASDVIEIPAVHTDWPMLGSNPAHSGYNRDEPGASHYSLAWRVKVGYSDCWKVWTDFTVSDGVLTASTYPCGGPESKVIALDAYTGVEFWRHQVAMFAGNFQSSTAIANGTVFYGVSEGAGKISLYSRNLYSGAINWETTDIGGSATSPVVYGDKLYTSGNQLYDIAIVNTGSGHLHASEDIPLESIGHTWTAAYANDRLYTWFEYVLREHNGNMAGTNWEMVVQPDWWGGWFTLIPVIEGNTAIVASDYHLYAIDLASRSVRWTKDAGYQSFVKDNQLAAIADNVVYAINDGVLEAYDVSDGHLLWHFDGDGELGSQPVVTKEFLYVASNTHTYILDRQTHSLVEQIESGGWLAVTHGFLYIESTDGYVYAYRAQAR